MNQFKILERKKETKKLITKNNIYKSFYIEIEESENYNYIKNILDNNNKKKRTIQV